MAHQLLLLVMGLLGGPTVFTRHELTHLRQLVSHYRRP